jgi:xanthine dehydrogenase accessory factor
LDIYPEILTSLEAEDRVMLATIISTSGSTPASAFSKMLVKNHGTASVGTVGGGCMEGDVLQAAKRLYQENRAEILTFHLNEDEFVQGLICGGSLDVLIEPITKEQIPLFQRVNSLRDEGEDCVVATVVGNNGTVRDKELVENRIGTDGLLVDDSTRRDYWKPFIHQSIHAAIPFDLAEELRMTFHRHETRRIKLSDGELILEPIPGTPNLIIFGGGHVSKFISKAAAIVGFRATIVDERENYANPQRFPEAARTMAVDFSEAFRQLTVKPSTYIVIVTRGHRDDEEILEQAIKTPAKYIGMIGSKRKVFTTYEHLVERGVPIESLKRVHAPMGLEIGATTAEEIGISVVAELVAIRREEETPYFNKSAVMEELISRLEKKYSLS